MKQVSQQDYEVLKKYHPHEIRYYVEIPPRVTISKGNGKKHPTAGQHLNRRVQLTTAKYEYKPNSISAKAYKTAVRVLDNDPTVLMGRTDLANQVRIKSGLRRNQVEPVITDLLAKGLLRYAGEARNGA